jgi:hypothetical protein
MDDAQPQAAQPGQAPAGADVAKVPYDPNTMGPRTATPEAVESTLNPHGYWVVLPGHGRVWVPNKAVVGADFRPYDRGHWANTEFGWTWVSDYNWGWVPFHYGRWIHSTAYGYAWIPGYRWSPAWVTWRHGGGYVGWAPYGWRASWGYNPWVFVGSRYFLSNRIHAYALGRGYIGTIWGRTAFIGGFRGPSVGLVRGWGAGYRGYGVGYRGGYRGGFRGTVSNRVGTTRSNTTVRGSHGGYNRGSHTGANYGRGSYGANRGSYGAGRGSYSPGRSSISAPRGGYSNTNRGSYSGRSSVSSGGGRRR